MRKTKKNTIKKTEGEISVDETLETNIECADIEDDDINEECTDEDIDAMIEEVAAIEDNIIEETPAPIVEEKPKKETSKKKDVSEKMVYRFFGVYDNIKIVGQLFNNIRIPLFEVIATSLEDALTEYKTTTMSDRNMSMKEVHLYFKRIYGKNIRVEVLPIENVKNIHTIEL